MINFDSYQIDSYCAHPWELLNTHLFLVGNEMQKLWEKTFLKDISLGNIFFWIWFCHDFGKYTKIFQYYMHKSGIYTSDNIDNVQLLNNYKEHAILWAFLYFYIIWKNKQLFLDLWLEQQDIQILSTLWFYAIAKHHWDLENLSNITDIQWLENKIAIVKKQFDYLDFDNIFTDLEPFIKWNNITIDFHEFKQIIERTNIVKICSNWFETTITNMQNQSKYINLWKNIYSSLIYSDKYKTIFWQDKLKTTYEIKNARLVDIYKTSEWFWKTKNSLNKYRNKIYKTVTNSLKEINLSNHIYTLNAPTGSWKTFNLMNIWLKLKSKLKKQWIRAKIIYGLPFTSIIDQVYEQVCKILLNKGIDANNSKILLKHHHLSNPNFDNIDNKSDLEVQQQWAHLSKFMTTAWESEIVVTTFYQIFNTFFCNKNKTLIKMPNIQNAIILLDEIQSTPYKYWWNFKDMFLQLSQEYNCYFVLSSATLPLLFDKTESIELLEDNEKYFQSEEMNRTELDLSKSNTKTTLKEFVNDINESLITNPNKSHLIVMNTIKSSLFVYENIINKIDKKHNELLYLSSNIIPKHRKQIIETIKWKSKKRLILVSTQIVEAWVDIDFDIWFRDLGPIDNVIQVLWRLNRNWNKIEKWVLHLYNIKDENNHRFPDKEYSSYIYDFLLLNITKNMLTSGWVIQEKDYCWLFNLYFAKIKELQSNDTEIKIRENRNNLNFKSVCEDFSLINKNFATIDIFVNIEEQSQELMKQFNNIRQIKNKWDRKAKWEEIKNQFAQYVISVDIERVKLCGFDKKQMEMWLVFLQSPLLEEYYNMQIGFVPQKWQDLVEDNFI